MNEAQADLVPLTVTADLHEEQHISALSLALAWGRLLTPTEQRLLAKQILVAIQAHDLTPGRIAVIAAAIAGSKHGPR